MKVMQSVASVPGDRRSRRAASLLVAAAAALLTAVASRGAVAVTPHASAPSSYTMPPGAYLMTPAPTADALRREVAGRADVRSRYARLWKMDGASIVAKIGGLHLAPLAEDRVLSVYYYRPNQGAWGYKVRRVSKGTAVFADRAGAPVLMQVCGNPVENLAPSKIAQLGKVKAFDARESDTNLIGEMADHDPLPMRSAGLLAPTQDDGLLARTANGGGGYAADGDVTDPDDTVLTFIDTPEDTIAGGNSAGSVPASTGVTTASSGIPGAALTGAAASAARTLGGGHMSHPAPVGKTVTPTSPSLPISPTSSTSPSSPTSPGMPTSPTTLGQILSAASSTSPTLSLGTAYSPANTKAITTTTAAAPEPGAGTLAGIAMSLVLGLRAVAARRRRGAAATARAKA